MMVEPIVGVNPRPALITHRRLWETTGMTEAESTTKPARTCELDGCERKHDARGFCNTHYKQRRVNGTLRDLPPVSFEERFWAKVNKDGPGGCWLWTASLGSGGYGQIKGRGETLPAYRVAYELLREPIPSGLELDHLCRVKRCVNPDHLEAVTHRENILRGESPGAKAVRTGLCKRGHSDWRNNGPGKRTCGPCKKKNRAKKKAAQVASEAA